MRSGTGNNRRLYGCARELGILFVQRGANRHFFLLLPRALSSEPSFVSSCQAPFHFFLSLSMRRTFACCCLALKACVPNKTLHLYHPSNFPYWFRQGGRTRALACRCTAFAFPALCCAMCTCTNPFAFHHHAAFNEAQETRLRTCETTSAVPVMFAAARTERCQQLQPASCWLCYRHSHASLLSKEVRQIAKACSNEGHALSSFGIASSSIHVGGAAPAGFKQGGLCRPARPLTCSAVMG